MHCRLVEHTGPGRGGQPAAEVAIRKRSWPPRVVKRLVGEGRPAEGSGQGKGGGPLGEALQSGDGALPARDRDGGRP